MTTTSTQRRVLLLGPSASGISTAQDVFRSLEFAVIEGLSPSDATALATQLVSSPTLMPEVSMHVSLEQFALAPAGQEGEAALAWLKELKQSVPALMVIYLSASAQVLGNRRRSKLDFSGLDNQRGEVATLPAASIEDELQLYKALKPLTDYHIDTSQLYGPGELRHKILKILDMPATPQRLSVQVVSFGFKYGQPDGLDLMFDARFLPNPFYDPALRPMTGLDQPVCDYIRRTDEAATFLQHLEAMLLHVLPLYRRQGKGRVNIGIGCTGGQHRSVMMTCDIAGRLAKAFPEDDILITHRDERFWPRVAAKAEAPGSACLA